ncbi:sensor histidine kinase [Catenulispora sp. NF23]|uniref:histidine kinase n=1 Tax=Catenulispora pinistramenti TaxID=2705254 RepID=A0ABS5L1V3_9ACTN|nr:sensor histidine kinase [Catenulispora pinistramenti]MBS2538663.1 sensor histidine kinase [Catenulispora pinistramenti]MBS2552298.1 sensor histidine kinase [Catenulispora pinistramenti]
MLSTGAHLIRAFRPRRPRREDVLVAVIVLLLNSGTYLIPGVVTWGPWRYLLETATIVPLLWRETHVVPVAVVTGTLTLVVTAFVHPAQPFPFAVLVVEYTIGSVLRGRTRAVMVGIYMVGNVTAEYLHKQMGNPGDFFITFTLSMTSLFLGVLMQSERDSLSVRADRSLRTERARIARDMHDVVGHAVALMVVQAEAGPLFIRDKPERAEAAFEAISAAGRDAMAQLRGLVGTLQSDREEAGRGPLPTLADLDELVHQVRRTGLQVRVEQTGSASALSSGAETAAYRVVQEALTNTLKHARASRAEVRLTWSPSMLEISVADNGRGLADASADGGHGLSGLRERLAPVGGALSWTSPPDTGGFALTAVIPSGQ